MLWCTSVTPPPYSEHQKGKHTTHKIKTTHTKINHTKTKQTLQIYACLDIWENENYEYRHALETWANKHGKSIVFCTYVTPPPYSYHNK